MTTNADGIYVIGSRAALNVTNSLFYGQSDDGINLHTRTAYFYSLIGNVLTYAPAGGFDDLKVGDAIEIYNPSAQMVRCDVIATSNPYACNGGLCSITVNGAEYCFGMISYNGYNQTSCDQIANNCQTYDCFNGLGSNISNNYFYGSRGRAIVNHDWKTTIQNNVIGSTYYGIPNWYGIYEGFCSSDLQYNEGRFVYPGHDGGQVISGNTGVYGNTVYGCWPGQPNP